MPKADSHDTPRQVGPGRPRSPEAEGAILDATLWLLAQDGLEGLSMDAVAARAGVGKATIYRRWPSREDLVKSALGTLTSEIVLPNTGHVRDDLISLLQQFQRAVTRTLPDEFRPRLIAITLSSPRLFDVFLANVLQPRRQAFVDVLERGKARGELRPDLDADFAFLLIHGPILQMALIGGGRGLSNPETPASLVDALLEGLAG
jgi:AcrR family transcriptional regulator